MNVDAYFENIKSFKLLAQKEIGQNFLIDPDVSKRIVDALEIKEGEKVLEIGFGAGSLSYFLSESEGDIDLIDIDERFISKAKDDFKDNKNMHPQYGNAMKFDYSPYKKIIGNLPYYITSGIIEKAISEATSLESAVFMVQKEAATRILAKKGSKDYSPLTIYLNRVAKIKPLFNVGKLSFAPIPHVDSTVLRFEIIKENKNEEAIKMLNLAKALFHNRRKTVFNNLKTYLGDGSKAKEVLEKANIPESKRPEELVDLDYLRILKCL